MPIKVFSSWIFFHRNFLKDLDHNYRTTISKKNSLWLLQFFVAVATSCYGKRCIERYTLQLYHTSLKTLQNSVEYTYNRILSCYWKRASNAGVFWWILRNDKMTKWQNLTNSSFYDTKDLTPRLTRSRHFNSRRIGWVCLTILWGWRLKG